MPAPLQNLPLPPTPSRARELLDLLASMRFAVSLLTVICIASVIGTVLKQREPYANYVNQFGPFWAEVFDKLGLYTVYGAWWFLLILAFLVLSTSLCIARNTPKILADLRNFKEHLREQSLQAFHLKAIGHLDLVPEAALQQVSLLLAEQGWRARAQWRERGVMVAARKGAGNKLGYLAAHSAVVLICLGGLLDGDLLVRALMHWQGKSVYDGGGLIRDIDASHRVSAANPSFRGSLLVPEGGQASTAVLNMPDGVLLQELPFDVELKKFTVEYYETGMPKLFASDITIHDRDTGASRSARVKVNEPVTHRGITIYQSSFDDGGSRLKLRLLPLTGEAKPSEVEGVVGGSAEIGAAGQPLKLEFTGLRLINVENLNDATSSGGSDGDERKVDLIGSLQGHLGSGAKTRTDKTLRNVGPSFSYKLRDAAGQAREYNNYLVPLELDGRSVFLLGVRENPGEDFHYLRIPADGQGTKDAWLRLRRDLAAPEQRERAARRYAAQATPNDKPEMTPQLFATAQRALSLFSGADAAKSGKEGMALGGLPALSQFVDTEVAEGERQRVSEVLLRILNGSLFELYKLGLEQAGQPAATLSAPSTATQAFMTQAVLALSDSMFYPAPMIAELADFTQVQASVFQVTRAPGQTLVYLGAVLLAIGVFTMLYVKERRLWIWLEPAPGQPGRTRARMAMSSTRSSPDTAVEFNQIQHALLKDDA